MNEIDLHVHTTASGHGFNSLEECAKAAENKGMKAIAITDHGPNLKGAPQSPYFSVLCNLVPETIGKVRILKGIESNILDTDGTIDAPMSLRSKFDIILVYTHPFTAYRDAGEKLNTRAFVRAFDRNPCIDIIAHPVTTWFRLNIQEVVEAASSRGIAIELNENSLKNPGIDMKRVGIMIESTLKAGGRFVVSSDAHVAASIGEMDRVEEIIRLYSIPASSIINKNLADTLAFVASRKEIKKL
jgi:putative hydrolase